MSQLTFDTLEFVKTLEKAGIPKAHAEAITAAQKQAFGKMAAARDLATKKDLLELEKRLDDKMAAMRLDIIKWFMGTTLTILGVTIAGFAVVISLIH